MTSEERHRADPEVGTPIEVLALVLGAPTPDAMLEVMTQAMSKAASAAEARLRNEQTARLYAEVAEMQQEARTDAESVTVAAIALRLMLAAYGIKPEDSRDSKGGDEDVPVVNDGGRAGVGASGMTSEEGRAVDNRAAIGTDGSSVQGVTS